MEELIKQILKADFYNVRECDDLNCIVCGSKPKSRRDRIDTVRGSCANETYHKSCWQYVVEAE